MDIEERCAGLVYYTKTTPREYQVRSGHAGFIINDIGFIKPLQVVVSLNTGTTNLFILPSRPAETDATMRSWNSNGHRAC